MQVPHLPQHRKAWQRRDVVTICCIEWADCLGWGHQAAANIISPTGIGQGDAAPLPEVLPGGGRIGWVCRKIMLNAQPELGDSL